jgi:Flp pilus assembly protein TadD
MERKKSNIFQYLDKALLTSSLCALGILAACSSATHEPKDANEANMMRVAAQMHTTGDDEGAAQLYQRIAKEDPDNLDAHKGLAELFEAHGDFTSAAGQYHALVKLQPDEGEWHRSYGRVLIKLNRPSEAKEQYAAALDISSDDIKARNGLGIALDYLGNHGAAQEQYKKALDQKSDDLPTISNLGHSYVLSGRYNEAIKLLEPLSHKPGTPPALRQNLAEAYALAGMDVDAQRMAQMDLPPDEVAKNMAFYRAERAKLASPATLYADLGSFTTSDLAHGRVEKLKQQFAKDVTKLTFEVVPEVKEIGGTPEFFIHVRGFGKPAAVATFCEKLKKEDVFCKVGS